MEEDMDNIEIFLCRKSVVASINTARPYNYVSIPFPFTQFFRSETKTPFQLR